MASVKTSVDNLDQQKREYEKAIKSLNNALEQIKKINRSLGNDNMLEGARTALTKLSASLETRASILQQMTKTLEQSGEKYTAAQKKAVAKSNQFSAHNRDFYGNPVVVTAASVVVSVTGADSNISITTPNAENVSIQIDSESRPSTTYVESSPASNVSPSSAHTENTATTEAAVTSTYEPSESYESYESSALTEEPISAESSFGTGVSQASTHVGNTATTEVVVTSTSELIEKPLSAEAGAVTNAVDKGASNSGASVFAAGAVIGSIAGAAIGSIGKSGQKKTGSTQDDNDQEQDIEAQLAAARERLRQLNEEENAQNSANGT